MNGRQECYRKMGAHTVMFCKGVVQMLTFLYLCKAGRIKFFWGGGGVF